MLKRNFIGGWDSEKSGRLYSLKTPIFSVPFSQKPIIVNIIIYFAADFKGVFKKTLDFFKIFFRACFLAFEIDKAALKHYNNIDKEIRRALCQIEFTSTTRQRRRLIAPF